MFIIVPGVLAVLYYIKNREVSSLAVMSLILFFYTLSTNTFIATTIMTLTTIVLGMLLLDDEDMEEYKTQYAVFSIIQAILLIIMQEHVAYLAINGLAVLLLLAFLTKFIFGGFYHFTQLIAPVLLLSSWPLSKSYQLASGISPSYYIIVGSFLVFAVGFILNIRKSKTTLQEDDKAELNSVN
jgi:hypothetical protein